MSALPRLAWRREPGTASGSMSLPGIFMISALAAGGFSVAVLGNGGLSKHFWRWGQFQKHPCAAACAVSGSECVRFVGLGALGLTTETSLCGQLLTSLRQV